MPGENGIGERQAMARRHLAEAAEAEDAVRLVALEVGRRDGLEDLRDLVPAEADRGRQPVEFDRRALGDQAVKRGLDPLRGGAGLVKQPAVAQEIGQRVE